ncbi:Flavin-binding monooxygenase-like family protein [Coccidioides posadasii C735 delta SOWgp]|uniref:Flavin-binding monooxygenase-like family protein n=1 Tax=Coccidioides posadasii (strain C735) TaxID=222929 RepID=C5PE73_COCP7|nr:Flavin-binding monooxygenase-like family protein [Coccidioides posadasii C735 delta SOWgp]EER24806.1 Flavin-binding monooxygenase-like family protein [Coccidioides posadasii C735 delta SOWgp]|eukprot:XP_003066951.1 Flavin-binding monooxygenase-like family protein [Coccidioides posadasii C735 delta SOWgp]
MDNDLGDPYADPNFSREPVVKDVEFLTVEGGWGGQLIAASLIKTGVFDLLIVEKVGDFGGIWYWNRYPGAVCDIEAYIYMPLLEELGYIPTKKYARSHDLYDKSLFQTEVLALDWDQSSQQWSATTHRNDRICAKFVATASGLLHNPKLSGIPGIGAFKGHSFHTTRWDYSYTGGDTAGGLDRISDKGIGIIGTGVTSIQAIPHLAEGAKHPYVFQRTPSSIDIRKDGPIDWDEDLINDNLTDILHNLAIFGGPSQGTAAAQNQNKLHLADFHKINPIRARVDGPNFKFPSSPTYNESDFLRY